jgi:hypothetical protein
VHNKQNSELENDDESTQIPTQTKHKNCIGLVKQEAVKHPFPPLSIVSVPELGGIEHLFSIACPT